MKGWFRELLERLAFRLMSVLSAKIESQLELELADAREQLLQRARELGDDASVGLPAIAQSLTEASARLGHCDYLPAAHELGALRRLEQNHQESNPDDAPHNGDARPLKTATQKPAVLTAKRGRGRPPKHAGPTSSTRPAAKDQPADQQAEGAANGQ